MARKADHRRADELHSCEYPQGRSGGLRQAWANRPNLLVKYINRNFHFLSLQLIFVFRKSFRKSSPDVVCIL
jgi:hypothetical protein